MGAAQSSRVWATTLAVLSCAWMSPPGPTERRCTSCWLQIPVATAGPVTLRAAVARAAAASRETHFLRERIQEGGRRKVQQCSGYGGSVNPLFLPPGPYRI